jgi:hypothetical protein
LTDGKFHAARNERIGDVARVRYRPRQTVEFRHDECIASSHGGERPIETGAYAMGPSQSAIRIDAIRGDPQFHERPLLHGQILFVGRAPRIGCLST